MAWAAKGRSKEAVHAFFDALGDRADQLELVTADGPPSLSGYDVVSRPPTVAKTRLLRP